MRMNLTIKIIVVLIVIGLVGSFFLYKNNDSFRMLVLPLLQELGLKEIPVYRYSVDDNVPIVYHALMTTTTHVSSIEDNNDAKELPTSLIMPPGNYSFQGKTYNLNKEGMYRFISVLKENQQRIVYERNVDALVSGISWLYTHGGIDDYKDHDELIQKALTSKIYAQCYTISFSLQTILAEQGIQSRVVTTLTLEPWNTYNNGHTMLEVFRDDYNKWVVYDFDGNAYFEKDKTPLSLIEWYQLVPNDDYEIKYLADDVKVDVSNVSSADDYDYVFLIESLLMNEEQQRELYKRVIQVVMIYENQKLNPDFPYGGDSDYLFFDERNPDLVESYSHNYKYMDREQFMERFYPSNPL